LLILILTFLHFYLYNIDIHYIFAKKVKSINMEEQLEFEVVIYLKDSSKDLEIEKYLDMGIDYVPEEEQEEKIVKYSFNPTKILEVRQTFVKYRGDWRDSVVVTYGDDNFETPPLLTTFEKFKR